MDEDAEVIMNEFSKIYFPLNECISEEEKEKWYFLLGVFALGWKAALKKEN